MKSPKLIRPILWSFPSSNLASEAIGAVETVAILGKLKCQRRISRYCPNSEAILILFMINLKIGLGGHRGRRGRRKISKAGPDFGLIPKGSQSIYYLSFQSVKLLSRHKMFILVTLRTLTYFSKEQR